MFRGFRGYTKEKMKDQIQDESNNYKKIQPRTDISIEEVEAYWNERFQKAIGNFPDEFVVDDFKEEEVFTPLLLFCIFIHLLV